MLVVGTATVTKISKGSKDWFGFLWEAASYLRKYDRIDDEDSGRVMAIPIAARQLVEHTETGSAAGTKIGDGSKD